MTGSPIPKSPCRVTDLVKYKQRGSAVVCRTAFEILPVDFQHRDNPFQAYIFLCRYTGDVDGGPYAFRKCYARGCPHNLCPHVSQAVLIANRYLQRDYHRLEQAGIPIERRLFTLAEMTVKYEGSQETYAPALAIQDYVTLAREGTAVAVTTELELVPAVEHFGGQESKMMFLMVDFAVTCLGKTHRYERCLACYPIDREREEKPEKVAVANARLQLVYEAFEQAGVACGQRFFSV